MSDPEPGTRTGKLWGGRFAGGPSPTLEALSRSTHFDWRLVPYDLAGSHAHAKALGAAGYLTPDDAAAIHAGLDALGERYAAGDLQPAPSAEEAATGAGMDPLLRSVLIAAVGAVAALGVLLLVLRHRKHRDQDA